MENKKVELTEKCLSESRKVADEIGLVDSELNPITLLEERVGLMKKYEERCVEYRTLMKDFFENRNASTGVELLKVLAQMAEIAAVDLQILEKMKRLAEALNAPVEGKIQ